MIVKSIVLKSCTPNHEFLFINFAKLIFIVLNIINQLQLTKTKSDNNNKTSKLTKTKSLTHFFLCPVHRVREFRNSRTIIGPINSR